MVLVDDPCHLAAPEKNTHTIENPKETPFVTQGIDIWSLGCVFSVAATYVVAGKEGVKQYHLLRQKACWKLNLGLGDAFHNTREVLPEVTQWHKYLRTCVRAQDTFTSRVLDIVDSSMLITPGEARIAGSVLTSELAKISKDAESQHHNRQEPPDNILEFLDEVMRSPVDKSLPALEDIPRTISQSGADMFEEALLYRSLRSEGRPPVARNIAPETDGNHTNFVNRVEYPNTGPPLNRHDPLRYLNLPQINTNIRTPSEPSPLDHPPITFWEIEAQLEQIGQKTLIPGLRSIRRQVSVYGKSLEGKEDQLSKHFDSRDLVSELDARYRYFLCRPLWY